MRARVTMLAVALATSTVLGACSSSGATSTQGAQPGAPGTTLPPQPRAGGKLSVGIDSDVDGFNPTASNFLAQHYVVASTLLEPLTAFDENRTPQPFLAESFTPENLASLWKIKLRPGIRFSNGEKLDAAAVKTNLDTARKGIPSITLKPITDTKVLDELTLEVDMDQPWASFPSVMASQEGYMEAPTVLLGEHAADEPVGTGPFKLVTWTKGSSIHVARNPTYWRQDRPYLDEIEFKILPDAAARSNALDAGDVDMILTNDAQGITDAQQQAERNVVLDRSGDVQHVLLNQGKAPFDDLDARKAVIYATDARAVADQIGAGLFEPADQPYGEGSPYHAADPHFAGFDLAKAKAAEAAYEKKAGHPLTFTLSVYSGVLDSREAQMLAEQWAAAGIKASIESVDVAALNPRVVTGGIEATLSVNYGFPDPDWNFIFWHSSFTQPIGKLSINMYHENNPNLDDLLNTGRANLVPSIREASYQRAIQVMNDDFMFGWLYRTAWAFVTTKQVHGLDLPTKGGFARTDAKAWWDQVWLAPA